MLENFLKEKTQLQAGKIRSTLEKQFMFRRFGRAMTMAEAIEEFTKQPECELECCCGETDKVNGVRFATKPTWSIMALDKDGEMSGMDITKVGAEYANWLMNGKFNLKMMESNANDYYDKNSKAAHDKKYGGMTALRLR